MVGTRMRDTWMRRTVRERCRSTALETARGAAGPAHAPIRHGVFAVVCRVSVDIPKPVVLCFGHFAGCDEVSDRCAASCSPDGCLGLQGSSRTLIIAVWCCIFMIKLTCIFAWMRWEGGGEGTRRDVGSTSDSIVHAGATVACIRITVPAVATFRVSSSESRRIIVVCGGVMR